MTVGEDREALVRSGFPRAFAYPAPDAGNSQICLTHPATSPRSAATPSAIGTSDFPDRPGHWNRLAEPPAFPRKTQICPIHVIPPVESNVDSGFQWHITMEE